MYWLYGYTDDIRHKKGRVRLHAIFYTGGDPAEPLSFIFQFLIKRETIVVRAATGTQKMKT